MNDHGSRRTWGAGPSRFRFGVHKGDPPDYIGGALPYWFYKVFAQIATLMLHRHPRPPLCTPYQLGQRYQFNPPQIIPTLEDHLFSKFHQDPSSGLDFYREHTHTHPFPSFIRRLSRVTSHCLDDSNEFFKRLLTLKIWFEIKSMLG